MTKVTLNDVASLQNETSALSTINGNSAVIETAFDNTLSRDGTSPNTMGASLDMNSNRIINLPIPLSDFEPLRVIDVSLIDAGGITVSPLPPGGSANQVLSKISSTNYDVHWSSIESTAHTWSASQIFNPTTFKLAGATSGTITLAAANIAGSNTISFPAATGTVQLNDGTVFTPGSILFINGTAAFSQNNSALFFDNANKTLGVGTNTPVLDNNDNAPGMVVRNDHNGPTRFSVVNQSTNALASSQWNLNLGIPTGGNFTGTLSTIAGSIYASMVVDSSVVQMAFASPNFAWENAAQTIEFAELTGTSFTVINTTASTSKTTGAIICGGGLGVALSANIGTKLNVSYTPALQTNMYAGFGGSGTGVTFIGQDPSDTSIAGIWMGVSGLNPTGANYTLIGDGGNTYLNAISGTVHLQVATADIMRLTSTGATLTTNATTVTGFGTPVLRIVGSDSATPVASGVEINAFASQAVVRGLRADGTAASKTAIAAANEAIFNYFGYGWDGANYIGTAGLILWSGETFTAGAHAGSYATIYTTPLGTNTTVEAVRFNPSGGLSIGTTSDPGLGMLYTNSATFMHRTKTSWSTGAAAAAGTLTNAPAAGNPTKWIPVDDNGTTRYIPAW